MIVDITPNLRTASNALAACAAYSVSNPTLPLKRNPYYATTRRTHRLATGSVNTLWVCVPCGNVMPRITHDLTTECCGRSTITLK